MGNEQVATAPYAGIVVTNASDDTAASIWEDESGTTPISGGSLTADDKGFFIFYADQGVYNISITSDGITKVLNDVLISKQYGYTPEDAANREIDTTLASDSDNRYPTTKAVRAYINTKFGRFRKIYVMDYIDSSQWAYIDAGNTAAQNSTLIATGLAAAITATQTAHTELELAAGIFLTDKLSLDGFDNSKISGSKGAQLKLKNTFATLMELRNSNNSEIEGILFVGTATADGAYREHDLIDVRNGSGFITITGCDFTDFARWGILGRLLTGSTYTEGLTIFDCGFYDAPSYQASYSAQAGVALGGDGEYSLVSNCRFYRIPAAARFTDGANSRFVHNRVMQLNGGSGVLQTDRACIYAEYTAGGNGGKLEIASNTINHNESGLVPIIVRQNPSQPQNSINIHDNYLLVNGNASVGYQIVGYDCYDLRLTGNIMRPATAGVNPNVRLNDCDGARVTDNDFRDGTYGLEVNSSVDVQYGHNSHNGQTVGKVLLSSGGTIKNRNNRAFTFRVTSAGAASTPWDKSGWTVAKTGVGVYTITHDIGTTNYGVIIQQDNDSTPDSLRFSAVRGTTTAVIYTVNGSGTATDANVTVMITIGHDDPYVM